MRGLPTTEDFFPDAPVSLGAQIACVERELKYRRDVYPRMVRKERMTQRKMDQEIACMEAVLETLRNVAK